MGKGYTRFQTKTAQKTLPDGAAHTYMAYIREYPRAHIRLCKREQILFWPRPGTAITVRLLQLAEIRQMLANFSGVEF